MNDIVHIYFSFHFSRCCMSDDNFVTVPLKFLPVTAQLKSWRFIKWRMCETASITIIANYCFKQPHSANCRTLALFCRRFSVCFDCWEVASQLVNKVPMAELFSIASLLTHVPQCCHVPRFIANSAILEACQIAKIANFGHLAIFGRFITI